MDSLLLANSFSLRDVHIVILGTKQRCKYGRNILGSKKANKINRKLEKKKKKNFSQLAPVFCN